MRRSARLASGLMAGFAALVLVAAPMAAEARPGGGSSSGSRGSRSYSAPPATGTAPGGGTTFNRTEAQRPGIGQTAPAAGVPARAPARSGFMGGLMGGLLGAGLIGMLFGSGLFGGMASLAGFLGFLLQIALIGGLVWLVLRLVRGARQGAAAPRLATAGASAGGGPGLHARDMMGDRAGGPIGGGGRPVGGAPVQVGANDFQSFERILSEVNAAWTRRDVSALRRLATPEMARYFEGDLRDLEARGWRNETSDVRLEAGDLSEAWNENGTDYATVAMRFSMIDVTRDAGGAVVEGDPARRQTATELWTFLRRPGTAWTLSAIQQANGRS